MIAQDLSPSPKCKYFPPSQNYQHNITQNLCRISLGIFKVCRWQTANPGPQCQFYLLTRKRVALGVEMVNGTFSSQRKWRMEIYSSVPLTRQHYQLLLFLEIVNGRLYYAADLVEIEKTVNTKMYSTSERPLREIKHSLSPSDLILRSTKDTSL